LRLPPLRHLAAATLLACTTLSAQAQVTTGDMTVPRLFHQTSTLSDGRILITGGNAVAGTSNFTEAEIYDPATGQFAPVAPMLIGRSQHASVTLLDGRVLVAGGTGSGTNTNTAEIYDPASGKWSATGNMNALRFYAMARLLPDGRVMVMGRDSFSNGAFADIFDPATGTFSKTGNFVRSTGWHGLVVLNDGRVLKVGGENSGYTSTAEIWNPATNQWTATGAMAETRSMINAVLLPDGKVLVAGGRNVMSLRSSEIYDPATGTFSAGASAPIEIQSGTATVLANGNVLYSTDLSRKLLHYRADNGTWSLTGPQRTQVRAATAAQLPDGNVLIAGGAALNNGTRYSAIWDQACAGQATVIAPATQSASSDGGTVTLSVSAAPGCRFEVANLPEWLTLDGDNPRQMPESGPTTVSLSAAANQTGAARSASILLGNETVTVNQPASPNCPSVPTVSPAVTTLGRNGGGGTLTVAAGAACPWSVASMPSFVSTTGATSGTGNGSITYSASANPDAAARGGSGQIVALGQASTFSFTQDGQPCPSAPVVSLDRSTFPVSGGTANGTVAAASTCPWTVSAPGWGTVTSGASGTGNGSFAIAIAANTGAARSASGVVSGVGVSAGFVLSQEASPCANWSASPNNIGFTGAGGASSITVTAPAGCTWSLAPLPSWLALTSAGSGNGSGTIGITATANTGAARSATATISGSGPTLNVSIGQMVAQGSTCSTPIYNGAPVNVNLQSMNCETGARGSGYYTNRHTFSSAPGRFVTITMSSSSFDTYLYLRDPAGNVIKSDDDSGGGTNSRIGFTLPAGMAGTYIIEATSYYSGRTGPYTLTLTQ